MAFRCLSPLSGLITASLPHVFEASGYPSVPNPILESHEPQLFLFSLTIPILALECPLRLQTTLNPSFSQSYCNNPCEPINSFHLSRPRARWRGIAHQRSVKTESQLACGWQWTWAVVRSSCRDRSWGRMCSSRWVPLIPVRRTQSLLQEGCILYNHSSKVHNSEKWSEED